ncbi:MAG: type II secretion system protein [Bdellovibrionales bacterium]
MKNTKREYKNSRGMSLIEIVIAISVMGVISAGVGTAIVQMSNSQKKIENKVELNDTLSSLSKYLGTKDFCDDALINKKIGSGINLVISNFKGVGGGGTIKNGSKISDSVRVDSIRATINTKVDSVATMFEGAAALEQMVDVAIQTSRFDPGSKGKAWMPSPERRFMVPVKTIGGIVKSCNHLTDEESSCTAISGVWNASTKACVPDSMCENKGTYIKWTCTADKSVPQLAYDTYGVYCGKTIKALSPAGSTFKNSKPAKVINGGVTNLFTKNISCPSGSTKFHTGVDKHAYSGLECGKKCTFTYNQTANFYTCMKCN